MNPSLIWVVQSNGPRQLHTWSVHPQDLALHDVTQTIRIEQVLSYLQINVHPLLEAGWTIGIWSKPCELHATVKAGDRIELYRPLKVDPKLARRARFAKQGSRGAGLFRR